jgi:amino acid adenylation domain-containing protein
MTEPAVWSEVRPKTLAGVLRTRAAERPNQLAFTFLADGEIETERWTYAELDARATAIAAALAESVRPGERALLLFPPGLDFIAAFFGCLYAGVVAVPAYPPRPNDRSQSRLRSIARDAEPKAALTTSAILVGVEGPKGLLAIAPELAGLRWLPTDALGSWTGGAGRELPEPDPGSVAFLQYTSGSTAAPKGVMVTQANLVHNERMISAAFEQDEESVVVGWLPLYHDMGLIGNVLQPLHSGGRCVLMSPVSFLQKPLRWLAAISRYRATTSGGPNFAYELCARKIGPEAKEGLDLSSWRVAYNGAEPVRAETLERFAEAFEPCGFRRGAFYPCYGLAEATLFVTGGEQGRFPRVEAVDAAALERHEVEPAPRESPTARLLVSCGRASMGQKVAVVDPEAGVELPPGMVGEIWVSGPSVARGYWKQDEATERDFNAFLLGARESGEGPYLRTGDLGFFSDGELFVTGRLKDLIILRGRNHYPQDIELTAERSHPDLRPGNGAAFSVEVGGEERLVVAHEVERRRREGLEEVAEAVRRAVAEEHEVTVHEVVLLRVGTLPKTSSGKVQRRLCRELYLADGLVVVGRSALATAEPAAEGGLVLSRGALFALEPEERPAVLAAFLAERAAEALGVPASAVSPEQPLSGLGLDSLAAVELKGSVEAALGLAVPLADLLQGIGARALAEKMLANVGEEADVPPVRALSLPGDQPLSSGQKGLWFLQRMTPEGGAYNIAVAARARGLDPGALKRALATVVVRHEALRTVFRLVGEEPAQRVLPEARIDFAVEDARSWPEGELTARLALEAWRPFPLETGPLARVRVFERGGGEQVLLFAVHHLVADFWSLGVVARELGALYRQETGGPAADLPPVALQYTDFVHWQAERLAGERGEKLWGFWRERLAGLPDLDLPTDRPRPPVKGERGGSRALALPSVLAGEVRAFGASRGSTLFMTLLAAFAAQLARYSNQEDFAVGAPTAGRPAPELAGLVGYLVNTVALRADLSGEPGFGAFLARVRAVALEGLEHGDYPFPRVAERLRPARDPARSPLFQAMLVLQRGRAQDDPGLAAFALGEDGARLDLGGLALESVRIGERRAQFDLTLRVTEDGAGGMSASLEYDASLWDEATAERMLGHFRTLLGAAVAAPETPVWKLPLLTAGEQAQLLAEWNETSREYPRGLLLHQPFEERAAERPEAEALVAGDVRLTYQELNRRANRLAHHLRKLGVKPEDRVGVCLRRSERIVSTLLAVLKAGGAYVPLDPAYPQERLELILEDSGARWVVTEEGTPPDLAAFAEKRAEGRVEQVFLDADLGDEDGDPEPAAGPGNLAYLIYTSGSTGKPKAVAIEHRSAVVLVHWAREVFSAEDLEGVLAATSIGFDLSVFEIFVPLSWGGRVIVADNALALPSIPAAGEVTLINTVPSALAELVRGGLVPEFAQVINLAGEPIPPALVEAIQALEPPRRLYNLYGPSEDTTYSTFALLAAGSEAPIGRPLANTRVYLLDARGEPVPAGVPGELFLAGEGLARGYLGRPELTAERFVPDPFATEPGARLYRTGDLARWRRGGDLDFLGRIDHQVKVRGFRIELGEIEAALARHPQVREVVVVARDDGDRGKRLVAYVTPRGVAASELRRFLRESLPEHMVPSAFVRLDALPLSPNGKVDRKALPDPGLPGGGLAPAAPRSGAEELLAGLVAEVLGVPRVGPHDDFFALGGHSLLATRLVARIARVFGVELPVSALFVTPTVSGLAARIDQAGASLPAPPLVPVPRDGSPLPLSFAQKRLWLLDRIAPGNPAYNVPGALGLSGPLDLAAVERSLEEIVRRHEALRTVFRIEGGQPAQVILPPAVRLPLVDLGSLPAAMREEEAERLARWNAVQPFDLGSGPLYRALALRLAGEDHRLLVTFHHIVADGWSLAVFLGELAALYEGTPLPALPVQYADWTVWQREWLRGELLESQLAWWRERLADLPVLELPADRPRPARRSFRGGTRALLLPEDLAAACERLARRQGVTPFMVFLAAFQALLARSTGAPSIPVGSVVANRGRVEIEGLIGFFVNTVVLRAGVGDDPPFRELLARVREASLGAWAHQDLPFEQLVEALRSELPPSVSPLFQVLFLFEELLPVRPLGSVEARVERVETGTAKFDLTLSVAPGPEGLGLSLEYDADLFDPATADRLLGHWRTLLEGIVVDPGARLSALLPLTAAELEQIRGSFHGTATPSPDEAEFVLPRTELEGKLAAIWSEVLGVGAVGVHDNFFELGGHSLLGFQVISRVNAALGVDLPLRDLFEEPTVAGLARRLSDAPPISRETVREAPVPAPPAPAATPRVGGAAPRTPVEERLAAIWSEVLGVAGVGIHDDFFELGGHSLHAYQVSLRVAGEIGVEMPAQTLFDAPTVAALAERLAGAPSAVAATPAPAPVSGRPLSFAQQRLWLTEVLEPGGTTYNLAVAVRLTGDLEEQILARGLAEILRRHEPLRTVYSQTGGEPVQVVLPPPAVPDLALGRVDLTYLPAERRSEALDGALRAEAGWPFDLARGPVARFVLLRSSRQEHVLVASFHHIAADGWSMGVFFRELAALYEAFLAGRPSPLPELPLSYADFALWQRRQLEGEGIRKQLAWWRQELAGVPVLALPTDRPRSALPVHRGAIRPFVPPPELTERLRALAPAEGITLFVTLLGGFAALLARWTGQGDVPVGVPAAGRTRAETEGLIGFFVNTLVLRGRMEDDPPFLTLLRRLRGTVIAAQTHQDAPFDKLVEELHPHRDPGISPLFQVMFAFLAVPPLAVRMPGLQASLLEAPAATAKFDLTLSLQEREGSLEGSLEYRTDLFEAATIDRLLTSLTVLLEGAVADPSRRLGDLPLLTEAERRELLAWGGAPAAGAGDLLLHELFEERARLSPGAMALVAEHGALAVTYCELDLRANRLAHHLRALGVEAETPVAVCLERSPEMVEAMLGVWKAGGVYVPVDPSYPRERIELLLGDSGAALLVSRSGSNPEAAIPTVLLDRDESEIAARPGDSPGVAVAPRQLAYVIYTSGSTGRPKGVAVEHGASAAHCETMRRDVYGLVPEDRVLCFVSPGFDMVIEQTLPALTAGAAVVLRGPELWEPAGFSRRLGELGVTVTDLPAAYWQRWAHEMEEPGFAPPSLRLVGSGGGEMTAEAARRFRETALGGVRLINAYGPTETVITCSHWEVDSEIPGLLAPIGLPFPGRSAHAVDRHGNLVPLGAPGEAVVGGILARGYLGSPELTAERFVPDPFAGIPGARVYRTGDLVRRLPGGILEFLGRIDTQVKIRGFRVETGEVEAALAAHPEVRHAVAVALEEGEGDRRLAAYFVPEPGRTPSAADLQAFLAGKLPHFMVPSSFTRLDELPLTEHGKVDRRALPRPEAPQASTEVPGTPEEELLAGLWGDLLGVERVGPGEDFFALGGHSLLATQLISRVRRLFSVDLPVSALFEAPTPSALARRIAAARQEPGAPAAPPIVPVPRSPEGEALSFAQQRLWFLARLEPESAAYNVPGALRLSGLLLPAVLAGALAEIVRRHEALRTVFREGSRGPLQQVLPPAAPPLPLVDLRGLPADAREREAGLLLEREAKRPFDLASGPLLRAALLRLEDEEHLLGINFHHVVSDAWSLGLTLRELGALYRAFAAGSPSPLPELPVQYADFAVWQRSWLSGEVLRREIDHWRHVLAGAPEELILPLDRPRPALPTRPGGRVPFVLPEALATDLRALGRKEGWTPFMVLLAAFEGFLALLSGQRTVVVGSPIANRNRLETEGLIGFFTNTLALRLDLAEELSFTALAHRARAVTLDAHAHQDLPFEKLVEELRPRLDLARTPVFQVMLVFQNLPPLDPGLPGVTAEALDIDSGEAKFDLTLSVAEDAGGLLAGALEYDRELFDAATASRFLTRFLALLAEAVAEPGRSLLELPLLSAAERSEVATAWSRRPSETESGAPGEGAAVELVPPRTPVEELLARIWREVLEIERVGANQSFFDLGGHSLLAARLAFQVRELFGVDLPLRKVLEKPVLADLAAEIEAAVSAGGSGAAPPPIRPVPRDGSLPLSFAQERLWFLDRLQEGGAVYNVPLAVRLRGNLEIPALAAAFGEIVLRHETLRTTFPERDGEPVQVIAPAADLPPWELPVVDLAALPDSVRAAEVRALEERESLWPFPLERGPLLRSTAFRLAERDHLLLLNMHHVISDGWSLGVLLSEASVLYGAVLAGEPSPLPPLGVQYADFAAWQRRWLSGERLAKQVDFWQRQLAGAPAVLELPADRPRPAVQTQHGGRAPVRIPPGLADRLGALSRRRGVTPFMLLLAAWQTLLLRSTGQEDLVVGAPIAGRVRPEVEPLIGFFVNTLALRGDLSGNPIFLDLLSRVRKVALAAYAHQELPFEKLVDEIKPARDLAHQPLVQVMFALQNTPLGALELPGILLEPFELGETIAKLDATLALSEIAGRLDGVLEYNTDLFDRSTMIRLAEHYEILLEGIAADPAQRLADLHLLTAGERHQLLVEWADAGRSFHGVCLHQLFERQAALRPDAPAAVFESLTWSYGELDRRANQLAHHLLRLGVGPEVRVGLFVERSLDMLVGMLGTLKAGGAYVPLDPGYPKERLAFTLGDSGARVVLTQERLAGRLPQSGARVVRLDADWDTIAKEPGESPGGPVAADDVAYVIYTSGSTGKPKGVVIPHRAVVMYISTTSPLFGIAPGGRNMQFSSISFDASVEEIYGCLTHGATLYVRGEAQEGASELLAWMAEREITWAQLPTAFWHQLAAAMETESLPFPPSLRVLMIGGEKALAQRLVSWWKRVPEGFRFINAYGPTETTVAATLAPFPGARPVDESLLEVPLGRPLSFVRAYVLDRRLRPVPIGVTGELHLGGQGLARGYLGRPDLTAEKFIPHPFAQLSGKAGERLYRTGDIVRLLPDGMLEFVGRVDDQVKIRGFRIELGEIETTLARHPQVGEAVVMTREDAPGEKHLVAYVSAKAEPAPAPEDLTAFLAQELPAYMVPGAVLVLPSMPTNAHGKVDRRALAGIAPGPPRSRQETYVAPGSGLEERIAAVWREIFGIEQVGVHDNFFDLGGNSLLIVKLHSRLQKALGRSFPLVDLFKHPTVAALAGSLGATGTEAPSLDRARARTDTRRESMKQLQELRDRRRKAEKGSTRKP